MPADDAKSQAPPLRLSSPVTVLDGVGKARAQGLRRMGLHTVADLVRHLPARYERIYSEGTIDDLPMEGIGTTRGTVVKTRLAGAGRSRFEATLQDHTATLNLTWFNSGRRLQGVIKAGMILRVQGKVGAYNGYPQMVNAQWEKLAALTRDDTAEDRMQPIYPLTEGVPAWALEKLMGQALPAVLDQLTDPLDEAFLKERNMIALSDAYRLVHQPRNEADIIAARRRLAYNELLLLQLGIALKRHYARTMLQAPALRWSKAVDEHIRSRFPFPLTDSQDDVVADIKGDLQQTRPMNRLLQGDVGAGKTVVALYALLLAVLNQKQGALMAPTELLADQHYLSIRKILDGANVRMALLTGGQSASGSAARRELLRQIEAGEFDLVVGTQALVTDAVRFKDLAVVVVDEQHRFGVMQRAAFRERGVGAPDSAREADANPPAQPQLFEGSRTASSLDADEGDASDAREASADSDTPQSDQPESPDREPAASDTSADGDDPAHADEPPDADKTAAAGEPVRPTSPAPDKIRSPHYLVMTATPIPRTLSLTVFGDLDVSTISKLPPGRTPIVTRVVGPEKSPDVYGYLAKRVARGEQAYIVVPAIEDSGQPDGAALKNVTDHAAFIQQRYGADFEVAAIHGRLKRDEREAIMNRFRDNQIQVLVATTVIEVGVDVANATMMVVEHAERFGLAQLHQLRGRIGRGSGGQTPVCVFITQPTTDDANQRMQAIGSTTDGFKIAEHDLAIRGMGEFFGTRQHGAPPLRVAEIPRDMDLLHLAKRDAAAIVEQDPTLDSPDRKLLKSIMLKQYGETLGLIDVG